MQAKILDCLDEDLRSLVVEIELAAGFEIQVLPNNNRTEWVAEEVISSEHVGALTSATSAVIEYPHKLSDISREDYTHELLHLHRTFVERVPHLYPKQKADGRAAAGIENWLEHAVIYKRQIELCQGFKDKLEFQTQDFWRRFPWGLSGVELKFNAISRYMIARLYASDESRRVIAVALANYPPQFDLRRGAERAMSVIADKRAFARSVLDFCSVPTELFFFRSYERGNPVAQTEPV